MDKDTALRQFQCTSEIYRGHPRLRDVIVREKLGVASCEQLQEVCRLWNTNIEGLMELLGV